MYAIFSNGQQVGTMNDAQRCVAEANYRQTQLEIRTSAGELVGKFVPAEKLLPVPWDPTVTKEDLDRMHAEGKGLTIEEFWIKIGAK